MEVIEEEIIANEVCRCCGKTFQGHEEQRQVLTPDVKTILEILFENQLTGEYVCDSCFRQLLKIYQFREVILESRAALFKFIQDREKLVKPVLAFDHQQRLTNSNKTENPTFSKKGRTKFEPGSSKLQRLLEKFDVQFAKSDNRSKTKSPRIICPFCNKILTANAFPVHLQTHEGKRQYNFMCEVCSKKYASNSELVVHRRHHTKEKPFRCDLCEKKFFNCKKNLIQHFRVIHLNQRKNPKTFENCQICLKKFSKDYLYTVHMKKAHLEGGDDDGIKVDPQTDHFYCEICGGQYKTRRYLDNHVCLKGAGLTETCVVCSVNCTNRLETIKHLQEAHAEKMDQSRWKCLACDTVVSEKIVLHIESVHATKSLKCEMCDKELKNRRCLRNHIFVVHEHGGAMGRKRKKIRKISSQERVE